MRPGDANGPDSAFALRQEVASLRAQLHERERAVSALTGMVERQIGMIERYDAVLNSRSYSSSASVRDRSLSRSPISVRELWLAA